MKEKSDKQKTKRTKLEKTRKNKPARDPKTGQLLPGHTANPNGRPKDAISIISIIKRMLKDEVDIDDKRTKAEYLASKWLGEAMHGDDFKKLQEIVRYVDGMPTQKIDQTTRTLEDDIKSLESLDDEIKNR